MILPLAATGMKWIEAKMNELGVDRHPGYRMCFYVDSGAMISVHTPKYGVIEVYTPRSVITRLKISKTGNANG